MSTQDGRRYVEERSAALIGRVGQSVLDTNELQIFFPISQESRAREGAAFLDEYTWPTNHDPRQAVNDPEISGETYPGIWRNVSTRMTKHEEEQGVVLILRKGYATSLADDETHLRGASAAAGSKTEQYVRYWHSIAPAAVDGLITTAATNKTETDPVVAGQPLTGTWAVGRLTSEQDPSDGSHVVSQTLTKVYTITSGLVASLAALEWTETRENAILDLFGIQTGVGDNWTFIWQNLAPDATNREFAMDLSDASLVAEFAAGWTYATRKWHEDPESNTATLVVVFRATAWNTWGHDSYAADITVAGAAPDRDRESIRRTWLNIANADLATAVNDCESGTNVAAPAGYVILGVDVSPGAEGRFTISQTYRKSYDGTGLEEYGGGTDYVQPHALQQGTRSVQITRFLDYTYTDLPAGMALGDSGAAGVVVANETDGPDGNDLWTRTVKREKIVWPAWAGSVPDIDEYPTAGNRDREVHRRTWLNIRNADLSGAEHDTREGVGPAEKTTGYEIVDVNIRPAAAGSISVTQTERKSYDGTGLQEFGGGADYVQPHAFQRGVRGIQVTRFLDYTYTGLPAGMALGDSGAAGVVVANERQGPDGNDLWTREVKREKIVWPAWSGYDPDIDDYPSAQNRPKETHRRAWLNVRNGDLSGATHDAREGTGNATTASGYEVVDVSIRPASPGSFSVTQVQRQRGNWDVTGKTRLNPHGWFSGELAETVTRYEGYPEDTLPAGDPVGADNVISNRKLGPDAQGLYSRIVVRETVTWDNITGEAPDRTVRRRVKVADRNPDGYLLGRQYDAKGVPAADVEEARGNETASTGDADKHWVIDMLRIAELARGEARLSKSESAAWKGTATGDADVTDWRPEVTQILKDGDSTITGYLQTASAKRIWYRRTYTGMKTLTSGPNGAAESDAEIKGVQLKHFGYQVVNHGNNTYSVAQSLRFVDTGGGTGATGDRMYFQHSAPVGEVVVRGRDNRAKLIKMKKWWGTRPSLWEAVRFIRTRTSTTTSGKGKWLIKNSDRVRKIGDGKWYAECITMEADDINEQYADALPDS